MNKNPNRTQPFAPTLVSLSLAVAILLCILLGGNNIVSPVGAQTVADNPKMSADLDKIFNPDTSLETKVQVVVETPAAPTRSLLTELGSGGISPRKLVNMTMVLASVPVHKLDDIAARSDVTYVSLDRQAKKTGHVTLTTGADAARRMTGTGSSYDGGGIGIAVMDSGVFASHSSFLDSTSTKSRVVYSQDFTGEGRTDDPYGHGTHVAGVAAANASVSQGAYAGVARNANIINLRVLNSQGTGSLSGLLSAIDWVLTNRTTHNIRVVNMSLGTEAVDSYLNDPLCKAARKLVDAGVVVVAAAGNQGKDSAGQKLYGLIHSPGIDPSVITVGASNTYGTDARNDDGVATYSSRGPTRAYYTDSLGTKHYDNLVKPDLVAPGNKIVDPQSPGNKLVTENPLLDANVSFTTSKEHMFLSGTSMATPAVAGAAALLLEANPKLTPNMVKAVLMYTAQPLAGFNHFEQGAGQLNLEGAMRLAKLVRQDLTSTTPVGAPLLTAAAPTPQSTIAGWTFNWGGGLIMDHTFATGTNLITKYQKVYGLGVLLGDGTLMSDGVLMSDGSMMSDGVLLGDNILTSSGALMTDGSPFLSCGALLGDGVLLSDGALMTDGVVMSDGALLGDGALLADVNAQSSKALIQGDATASMAVAVDTTVGPPAAPSSLKVAVVSTTQLNLSWTDMSSDENGFVVERCTGSTCTNFVEVARAGANATTFSNTGLVKATTYRYRVSAYNAAGGSAYTAVVNGTTKSR